MTHDDITRRIGFDYLKELKKYWDENMTTENDDTSDAPWRVLTDEEFYFIADEVKAGRLGYL